MEISIGEGVIIKGQDLLKQDASIQFHLLFQDDGLVDGEVTAKFLDNVPSLVSTKENRVFMQPFTEQEILDVI